jgi:deoxyadenosine/deoxycytidine kinase
MARDYIDQLNHAYEEFFGKAHQGPPVLTIDTNDLNYVANPDDLKWVETRIRQTLRMSPYQEQLPLENQR